MSPELVARMRAKQPSSGMLALAIGLNGSTSNGMC